jgi:hypothetical protein
MTPSPSTSPFFSAALRLVFRRIVLAALALLFLVYLGDSLRFQFRLHYPAAAGRATGSVHRIRLYSIAGKNNKVEYQIDPVQPEEDLPCVHSLFPHSGQRPCWYVTRHANDPIPM